MLNPSGHINWIYPKFRERQEISLLLRKQTDYFGTNFRALHDGIFPVLAISQYLRKPTMDMSIVIDGSEDIAPRKNITPQKGSDLINEIDENKDLYTPFYGEFDLSSKLKKKNKLQLKLKLKDEDGTIKLYLIENFVIQE